MYYSLLAQLPAVKKIGWPWDTEVNAELYEQRERWPKLSIIMPSYQQGEFIEEAIRSVLLQNYPNLELIIIDGGSRDDTKEILEKYSKWISHWQSEKDGGQGNALNIGFEMAAGDYLGWINSDDFYNKDSFFVLASEIVKSNKDFYYGDALTVNEDNSVQYYWQANLVWDVFLRFGGLIASHSAFWKRTAHQPVWEKMNCNVDGELWIRLVKGLSRKYIKFPIGSFRSHDNAKSSDFNMKEKWLEDDINIAHRHGTPPGPYSIKSYVYRWVQSVYKYSRNSNKQL